MAVAADAATIGESHVDVERHKSDLYTRPGWCDAAVALQQIEQGKAIGDRGILWLRARAQRQLYALGSFLDSHAGKVLFVALLIIATFCVGLKSSTFHSNIEQLWAEPVVVEDTTMSPSTFSASPPPSSEVLSTHQMVVQTAVDPDASLLHPNGLLDHLGLIKRASQVTVTMFDITWRLTDICQKASAPNFDMHYIDQIVESVLPCSFVTPLDCFWEGSKLLGPAYPVHIPFGVGDRVKWSNLNPQQLMLEIKEKKVNFDYQILEDFFRRSGISTGYQEKPCLNPKDPECPSTAPNRNSSQPVDIGAELTSGCYGFAAKYMHWPEDLIVGGAFKNKTGHIKQAKALQTVVQLMGEHELYDFYSETYKVHHIGWTQDKAAAVLRGWQRRFAQEVEHLTKSNSSGSYSYNTFSTATLNKGLAEHSQIDVVKLAGVLVIAAFYAWIAHSGLAAMCVMILACAAAAGLGFCSLLGLPMNILTTHVLPFLSVGLALRDMFALLASHNKKLAPPELLQRTGPTILIGGMCQGVVFLIAATIPFPALRIFCLQSAVLTVFHYATILFVLPTLIALHMRCKKAAGPCFRPETKGIAMNNNNERDHEANLLTSEFICHQKRCLLTWVVNKYLTFFIFTPAVRVFTIILYAGLIVFCVLEGLKVEFDVKLSSFLPRNTQEYRYLEAQNKHFGFYNFYLVTTEFEYPLNQPLMYEYHASLAQVPNVLKDSNGGLNNNDFWLANFRDYLADLQAEFDVNRERHCLTSEKWFGNATEKAVLAFKLLAQTGIVEFPVDKSQIFNKKLVSGKIIDPNAFYNYLSVWNSNDEISYSSSQANLTPKPLQYYSSKTEFDLKIPKSQPLKYTQMPFYLKNLKTTNKIVETLKKILAISDDFNSRGLKNYPVGLIFAYFNQFLLLDRLLVVQLVVTVLAIVLFISALIHWSKLLCLLTSLLFSVLVMCLLSINGLTGTVGALHFIVVARNLMLIMYGFQTAMGSRERRLRMALELHVETMLKGDVGLLLCVAVLGLSNFEFIRCHMCHTLFLSTGASFVNVMLFFPTLLSILGPRGELQHLEHLERISTPPPKVASSQQSRQSYSKQSRRSAPTKATREPSLTTITEESCNQSIVVEPQVTVEYSSPESSSTGHGGPYTTKVTATANIKVELIAPVYRSKCKPHRSNSSSSSSSSSGNKHTNCSGSSCAASKRHSCRCCKNNEKENTDSDSSGSVEHADCAGDVVHDTTQHQCTNMRS